MANKVISTILNFKDQFSKPIKKTTEQTRLLKKQLKEASQTAGHMRKALANGFKAVGIGAVGLSVSLFALANKTAESMDVIDKMAERTGITRERLQELKYAASQCGVEFDSIENGVKTLTKNMGKADEESKRMTMAFADMGIKIKDSKGNLKSSSQLFEETIVKLADMKDQTQRNILGQKIFGGSFQDMIPLLNQGSKGIKALTDRSRELGLVVSEDAVKSNVVFGDTMADVKASLGALGVNLSNTLLPYLQEFLNFMLNNIPKIEPTVKNIIGGASDIFVALKDNMNWLIPVASGLLGAFVAFQIVTGVSKGFLAFKKATEGVTVAQALLNMTMLSNPFVQIALAVGALIAVGVLLWKNWDTVKEKAGQLWEGLKNIFGGVGDWFAGVFDGVTSMFKGFANNYIDIANFLIGGLNKINFKVPDWIPKWLGGGKEFGIKIPTIPRFATGTSYFKGGNAEINEGGRGEIVNLPSGAKVIPADKSEKIVNKMTSNDHKIEIHIHGNIYGEADFINKIGAALLRKIKKCIPVV